MTYTVGAEISKSLPKHLQQTHFSRAVKTHGMVQALDQACAFAWKKHEAVARESKPVDAVTWASLSEDQRKFLKTEVDGLLATPEIVAGSDAAGCDAGSAAAGSAAGSGEKPAGLAVVEPGAVGEGPWFNPQSLKCCPCACLRLGGGSPCLL